MPDRELQQQYSAARKSRDPRFDGRFFVAVKTTGIFCRPVCPARTPREQNVTYFQFAQQAIESGYRPCLRCRPDSAPGSFAWRGVSTTIQRALRLLSEELDTPMSVIASRLGISERYLTKLVTTEVGIAPKRFQLHSRLLLAKRLLQQTTMPVTDVALASGFQSGRSLHAHLSKDFGLTPGELRRKQTDTVKSSALTIFVPVRQPYNWPQVRDFLKLRALSGIETVGSDRYCRTVRFDNEPGFIQAIFDNNKGGFEVNVALTRPQHLQPCLVKLRRILDVDTDPQPIRDALLHAGLAPGELTPGLRLPGVWDRFEAGCRAIVGQQISIKAAINQLQLLSDELGVKHKHGVAFPSPEAVASSDLNMLRMPAARKQAIRDFATLLAGQDESTLSDDDILAIKGVGPWTLQYIKLRGQSEPDMFLAKDLIVARQVEKYAIRAAQAAPWRSYLTIQLWQLANQQDGTE